MKYSVRGTLIMHDEFPIINTLNNYKLWRLMLNKNVLNGVELLSFEAWVNSEEDKTNLFNSLKALVDQYGNSIDWHTCTHDENSPSPCVIAEEYIKKEGK